MVHAGMAEPVEQDTEQQECLLQQADVEQATPGECRICLSSDDAERLVAPCGCTGSSAWVHRQCLLQWCRERCSLSCEICGQEYLAELQPRLADAVAEGQAK